MTNKQNFAITRAEITFQNIPISPCHICLPRPPLFLLLWLTIQLYGDFIKNKYDEPRWNRIGGVGARNRTHFDAKIS